MEHPDLFMCGNFNTMDFDQDSVSSTSTMSSNSFHDPLSPQNIYQLNTIKYDNIRVQIQSPGGPFLRIIEQPCEMFRFRYKSEMSGMHGSLSGRSRKKTYPSVELCGYQGSAKIFCSLVQVNDMLEPHPHRLVMWKDNTEVDDPHVLTVGPDKGYIASFQGMSILYTGKKSLSEVLFQKKRSAYRNPTLNIANLRKECEAATRNINLNSVRLLFTAYDLDGKMLCKPVVTENIDNSKSAETCLLKITHISRVTGSCRGGDTVLIFVEKVNKKNIKIRFFEVDITTNKRVWESFAIFNEMDVHHQYGIVFKTPQYCNINITEDVKVYLELYRPKDEAVSEEIEFIYKASPHHNKRRRYDSDLFMPEPFIATSMPQIPLTVETIAAELQDNPIQDNLFPNINENYQLNNFEELFGMLEDYPYDNHTMYSGDGIVVKDSVIKTLNKEEDGKRKPTDSGKLFSERSLTGLKNYVQQVKVFNRLEKMDAKEKKLLDLLERRLSNGENVLHMCVTIDKVEYLEILLKFILRHKAIDILNNKNNQEETPLHRAVIFLKDEAALLLLNAGCDPNVSDENGNSALHLSVMYDSEGCMRQLLSNRARRIDIFNEEGMTPLHLAVMHGKNKAMEMLISAGADTHIKCKTDGRTLLHIAMEYSHLHLIEDLIELNADQVNDPTFRGCTVLHKACEMDEINAITICELLLEHGAVPTVKCDNKSPLDVALQKNYLKLAVLLRQYMPETKISDSCDINRLFNKNLCVRVKTERNPLCFSSEKWLNVASEMLDGSGKCMELVHRLGYSSSIDSAQSNSSRMLFKIIESDERVSAQEFYDLCVKLGIDDLAMLIKDLML